MNLDQAVRIDFHKGFMLTPFICIKIKNILDLTLKFLENFFVDVQKNHCPKPFYAIDAYQIS